MDDETRATWARAFATLGAVVAASAFVRFVQWRNDAAGDPMPESLWVLAPLALGFLLVAAQFQLGVGAKRPAPRRDDRLDH